MALHKHDQGDEAALVNGARQERRGLVEREVAGPAGHPPLRRHGDAEQHVALAVSAGSIPRYGAVNAGPRGVGERREVVPHRSRIHPGWTSSDRPVKWTLPADVAQLARASACHAEGRGFESHHPLLWKPWFGVLLFVILSGAGRRGEPPGASPPSPGPSTAQGTNRMGLMTGAGRRAPRRARAPSA